MDRGSQSNIGIVSDFLFEGGSEAVVEVMSETFDGSTIYTAVCDPDEIKRYPSLHRAREEGRQITSFAQAIFRIPGLLSLLSVYHFYWLYFLGSTFQKTREHSRIIVSCCANAKLVKLPKDARAAVYFHTPTRWLYRGLVSEADLAAIPGYLRPLFALINAGLRPLDRLGVRRLQRHNPVWLCNSSYTKAKLAETYGIDCEVLYPPVDIEKGDPASRRPGDFYLYHGRLSFQKRVDVAIEGCLLARRKLVVSGRAVSAEMERFLHRIVDDAVNRDPSLDGLITFAGRTSDEAFRELMSTCRALIFPPREDFGIVPIEAIATGVPVIAFNQGGALDYVKPGENGMFFDEQSGASLAQALTAFEGEEFDPQAVARSIADFSREAFVARLKVIVEGL